MASSTMTGFDSFSISLWKKKTQSAAAKAASSVCEVPSAATGVAPSAMSRIIPPDSAAATASTAIPKTSRSRRTASIAPDRPKTKVPRRSSQ